MRLVEFCFVFLFYIIISVRANNSTPGYIITNMYSTTKRPAIVNITIIYNPDTCSNWNYSRLINGTCVTRLQAQVN